MIAMRSPGRIGASPAANTAVNNQQNNVRETSRTLSLLLRLFINAFNVPCRNLLISTWKRAFHAPMHRMRTKDSSAKSPGCPNDVPNTLPPHSFFQAQATTSDSCGFTSIFPNPLLIVRARPSPDPFTNGTQPSSRRVKYSVPGDTQCFFVTCVMIGCFSPSSTTLIFVSLR